MAALPDKLWHFPRHAGSARSRGVGASVVDQEFVASRIAFPVLWVGSVAPAMPVHRQAAVTPSRGPEKRPFGHPCKPLGRRCAGLVMRRRHGDPRA